MGLGPAQRPIAPARRQCPRYRCNLQAGMIHRDVTQQSNRRGRPATVNMQLQKNRRNAPIEKKGVEFLLQAGWTPGKDIIWLESERIIGAGFNISATENLEIITEVGWEFNEKNFAFTVGLIYAL